MKVLPASLIICSRNRPELLRRAVDSVLAGDSVPAELVIIDQSDCINSDLTCRSAEAGCVIRYEWVSFRGVSRARNAGVRLARHDMLAFIDDDVEVTSGWFTALMEALGDLNAGAVVTGSVLPHPSSLPGHFATSLKEETRPRVYQGRIREDVLYTGNMAARRATVKAVGGFDERLGPGSKFPAAEDNDLGFRLLEAGCMIVYAPKAKLYHVGWRPHDRYLQLRWFYGRGQGAFYAKHLRYAGTHMLRRLSGDIFRKMALLVFRAWRSPRSAVGDLVFASATIVGAAAWLLNENGNSPENIA